MAAIRSPHDLGGKDPPMSFHVEVLPPEQQDVLRQLGHAAKVCGLCISPSSRGRHS